jgi:FXSXX-COOH protein
VTGESPDYDTLFVDVTGIPLEQLLALDESALGHSLRRLVHEINNPQEAVAGHNSALPGPRPAPSQIRENPWQEPRKPAPLAETDPT